MYSAFWLVQEQDYILAFFHYFNCFPSQPVDKVYSRPKAFKEKDAKRLFAQFPLKSD